MICDRRPDTKTMKNYCRAVVFSKVAVLSWLVSKHAWNSCYNWKLIFHARKHEHTCCFNNSIFFCLDQSDAYLEICSNVSVLGEKILRFGFVATVRDMFVEVTLKPQKRFPNHIRLLRVVFDTFDQHAIKFQMSRNNWCRRKRLQECG